MIFVLVYLYFPFAALTLFAALERFDWRQLHAAQDLGATQARAVRAVMLPQIKPGITTAVIFVFIPILGEYLTPELVGGTRGVMIGNLVDNFFEEAQFAQGATVAVLIAAVVVILLVVFRRSLEVGVSCMAGEAAGIEIVARRGRLVRRGLTGWACLMYFFLFAPSRCSYC